jgi:2'-5' RNA ligase
MLRLFVAIGLPETVRQRLAALERGIPGARWLPPENLHLTLRFIGEVNEGLAEDAASALSHVHAPAFTMTLAGVGHFGHLQRAHSVWAGVEPCPPLSRLRDNIESALVRAGFRPEGRKFKPHVTLARVKGETGHHLANFLAEHNTYRDGPVAVNAFSLYVSHLSRSGAIYEAAETYRLAGPLSDDGDGDESDETDDTGYGVADRRARM